METPGASSSTPRLRPRKSELQLEIKLPVTPESQAATRSRSRSRKRKRSLSPSDSPVEARRSSNRRPRPTTITPLVPDSEPVQDLPPSTLLLSLPGILAVPPNHRASAASYYISLISLRRCLALESLPPDVECRAWTALAEIGFRLVRGGWSRNGHFPWAERLEAEVETAIGKGLVIAQTQQTASLTVYRLALTLLHSRLAHWQQNTKFSRTLLKRVASSFPARNQPLIEGANTPPPWLIYTTHLTSISHALALSPPDTGHAFNSLQDLTSSAEQYRDPPITLLTHVLRLRTLVDAGTWTSVGDSLSLAEGALGLVYNTTSPTSSSPEKKDESSGKKGGENEQTFISFDNAFEAAMAIHTLIMGVVYFTYAGISKAASVRLSHLHALLDSGALDLFPTGQIEIALTTGPSLFLKCTHPRVLYHLAFLVSSVAKRDAVGRKPKRKVFAQEGLSIWDKERSKEIELSNWAEVRDAEDVEERMVKMKADLLSELVAVAIMRSEFDDAEEHLSSLVAHTRTYGIFASYSARVTLHHAHLAHALGDIERAKRCYAVAEHLADEHTFVHVAAKAGGIALRMGTFVDVLGDNNGVKEEEDRRRWQWEDEVGAVIRDCKGMGGALEAVALVLQACLSTEILSAKTHLKAALDMASRAGDNHLRALILAFIASLYLRTSESHARSMLETCGQLAAGMGAPPRKADGESEQKGKSSSSADSGVKDGPVGNAPLGLWVGEQFLDIYKREGNQRKAAKQELINAKLKTAMEGFSERASLQENS